MFRTLSSVCTYSHLSQPLFSYQNTHSLLLYSSPLSLHFQKDLLAMLISQTDISQPDLTSSVHEAVGRDDVIMKAIKEYVLTTWSFYLSLSP